MLVFVFDIDRLTVDFRRLLALAFWFKSSFWPTSRTVRVVLKIATNRVFDSPQFVAKMSGRVWFTKVGQLI